MPQPQYHLSGFPYLKTTVRAHYYNWTEVASNGVSAATGTVTIAAETPLSPSAALKALQQFLYLQTAVVYR